MTNSSPRSVATASGRPVVAAMYSSAVGVDVHLDLLVCCYQSYDVRNSTTVTEYARLTTEKEKKESLSCRHISVETYAPELQKFAQWIRERDPEIVLMESTGVLWQSAYEALEKVGFTQQQLALVNARDVKAAVGRKTDKQDACRLAEYARFGRFKKSFVPRKEFRQMRTIARAYAKLRNDYARAKNRYQKMLNGIGFRAGTVFSDIRGKSATAILDALIGGEADMRKVIRDNCRRLKATEDEIFDALNFEIPNGMLRGLKTQRAYVCFVEKACLEMFETLREMQKPFEPFIELLLSITCVKEVSARLLFAEITDDLSSFATSEQFCSWMGICPGNNISAGKGHSGKSPKGNKWARRVLTEIAQGIGLSRNNELKDRFQVFKERRGTKRAIVAMGHKLARLIYCMFKHGELYSPRKTNALHAHRVQKVVRDFQQAVKEHAIKLTDQGIVNTGTGAVLIPAR